jgi:hypothetical protein
MTTQLAAAEDLLCGDHAEFDAFRNHQIDVELERWKNMDFFKDNPESDDRIAKRVRMIDRYLTRRDEEKDQVANRATTVAPSE